MANSTQHSRHDKPSLEELLRFKRSERPDEAFWDAFDSELHQRMMQTLVKKDPWYVQVLRGFSGKFAQTAAVAGVAAILALIAIRPTFVSTEAQSPAALAHNGSEVVENAEAVSSDIDSGLLAEADYEIEMLTAAATDDHSAVTQDYDLDHMEVASYDSDAYSADMAFSGFTSGGVASLVY